MMRIEAAGTTDTGQVRPANEDAYLVGESVFAVADGMGGHLAGEVASATALEPVEQLDGRVYSDAAEAVKALREAVVRANAEVSQMAADEPSYRGMGTTLTATMLEGQRVHIAHVGDSRAYLLREGSFSQLTDDHTLVQHLVDEGQITQEEAANHPQRSIITRAIGVSREVDVDSMTLDLEPGDQLLLCSDGLTGVLEDQRIADELGAEGGPSEVLQKLVSLANEAGGPDNITAVLLRVSRDEQPSPPDGEPLVVTTRDESGGEDWARRLGSYGSLGKGSVLDGGGDEDERKKGRGPKIAAIVFGVLLLLALLAGGARFLLAQSYFVGLEDEQVVIYQGLDFEIGPVELSRIVERTRLTADQLQPWYRDRLVDGVPAAGLVDARQLLEDAPLREDDEPEDAEPVEVSEDEADETP